MSWTRAIEECTVVYYMYDSYRILVKFKYRDMAWRAKTQYCGNIYHSYLEKMVYVSYVHLAM